MTTKDTNKTPERSHSNETPRTPSQSGRRSKKKSVTEARARAQRTKLDTQAQAQEQQREHTVSESPKKRREHQDQPIRRQAKLTVEQGIEDYLHDHEGGNHSPKTLEWHRTALGLLQDYFHVQQEITLLCDVDAPDISGWFTHLRKTPGAHGKMRAERTIQTYARSARAFFHWLVRQGTLQDNPFDRVVFPKVGKPLIQTITDEEFERLLLACAAPNEHGAFAERAAVRNRAILWILYDAGIRVSELINVRVKDLDRKHGIITVTGKDSKERRIALGQNCLRNVLYYLDRHRPDDDELTEWGSFGEDHLFLAESRRPLTKNGITLLFARLKKRANITGKRVITHIFRHTFAIRYLVLGNDPFSLQELLGHEDMATVRAYMHMNDETIQAQKRKYSPGDHLPSTIPGPRETWRRQYQGKAQKGKNG